MRSFRFLLLRLCDLFAFIFLPPPTPPGPRPSTLPPRDFSTHLTCQSKPQHHLGLRLELKQSFQKKFFQYERFWELRWNSLDGTGSSTPTSLGRYVCVHFLVMRKNAVVHVNGKMQKWFGGNSNNRKFADD